VFPRERGAVAGSRGRGAAGGIRYERTDGASLRADMVEESRNLARANGESMASISGIGDGGTARYMREGGRRRRGGHRLGILTEDDGDLLRPARTSGDLDRLDGRRRDEAGFLPSIRPKKLLQVSETSPRSVMDEFDASPSPRSPPSGVEGSWYGDRRSAHTLLPGPVREEDITSLGESILASATMLTDRQVDEDLRREERRVARTLRRRQRGLGDPVPIAHRPPTPLVHSVSHARMGDGRVLNELLNRSSGGMRTFRGGDVLMDQLGGAYPPPVLSREGRVTALPPLARPNALVGASRDAESYKRVQERRRASILRAASSLSKSALPTLAEDE